MSKAKYSTKLNGFSFVKIQMAINYILILVITTLIFKINGLIIQTFTDLILLSHQIIYIIKITIFISLFSRKLLNKWLYWTSILPNTLINIILRFIIKFTHTILFSIKIAPFIIISIWPYIFSFAMHYSINPCSLILRFIRKNHFSTTIKY